MEGSPLLLILPYELDQVQRPQNRTVKERLCWFHQKAKAPVQTGLERNQQYEDKNI